MANTTTSTSVHPADSLEKDRNSMSTTTTTTTTTTTGSSERPSRSTVSRSSRLAMTQQVQEQLVRSGNKKTSPSMIPRLAQKVDALLYRQARSLEEYLDQNTLEDRMQRLLGELFHACLQRQKQNPPTNTSSRTSTSTDMPLFRKRKFAKVVGEKLYLQIAHLVYQLEEAAQEIRLATIQSSTLSTTTTTASATSNEDEDEEDASVTTQSGNHNLILHCALVKVFDTTPIQAIGDVPWEILYLQGASALKAYQNTKQQQPEEAPTSSLVLLSSHIVAVRHQDPKPPLDMVVKCRSKDKKEQETNKVVEDVLSLTSSTPMEITLKLIAKQQHQRQGIAMLMRQPWASSSSKDDGGKNLQLLQRTLKDIIRTRDCVERKQEGDIYKRMRSLLEKRILKIG